jgi:hypothetical protein
VCTSSKQGRRHGAERARQRNMDVGVTLRSHIRFSIVSTCAHVSSGATGMAPAVATVILGIKPLGA